MPIRLLPLLLVALWAPLACAEAPSQEYAKEGFRWTLPSEDWEFMPVSADDARYGWVGRVRCKTAPIEAFAYVAPHGGLSLQDRMQEIGQAGADGLGEVVSRASKESTLSGVKGAVQVLRVKGDAGAMGHFRTYAMLSGTNFYHLIIRTWNDAHLTYRDELNQLRRGYRLSKGAGAEDQDEAFDEVPSGSTAEEGGPKGGEDERPSGEGPKANEGDDWGPNGPKRSGNTVTLPSHNIEWTLPEGGAFVWVGGAADEKAEGGEFLVAMAKVAREKQEFEKDTPDHNLCRMVLFIQKAPPGFSPERFVKGGDAQDLAQRWKLLDSVKSAGTRTKEEVNFGNWKAAYIKMDGEDRNGAATVLMFCSVLRGELYIVWNKMVGHTDAYKQLAPLIGDAIGGIRFLNTKEAIKGPLLGAVPEFAAARGEAVKEERQYVGPGFTFDKPEGMARLVVHDSMNQEIRHACEGRSEDENSYVYFEIRSYKLNIPNTPNIDPEEVVKKRMQDWEAGAGAEADTGKNSRGIAWKNGSFNGAKGITYEFKGSLNGQPFVEEGWVVKHKSNLFSVRLQLGGEGADKTLKDHVKALKKGLKWTR